MERYVKAKDRYNALTALRQEELSKAKAIDRFIATVSKQKDMLTELTTGSDFSLLDYAKVHCDGALVFHFYDRTGTKN